MKKFSVEWKQDQQKEFGGWAQKCEGCWTWHYIQYDTEYSRGSWRRKYDCVRANATSTQVSRTFILTNSFHGSQAKVKAIPGERPNTFTLSHNQVRRAKRALCGVSGCVCSEFIGTRGRQNGFVVLPTDKGALIELEGPHAK